jgi:hypothetical protein
MNGLGHSFWIISHAPHQVHTNGNRPYVEMLAKNHVKGFEYFVSSEDHNYPFSTTLPAYAPEL